MEKYLKLERLDTPPNTPLSSKNFNHWFRSFSSFLGKIIDPNIHCDLDKLDTLINCVSPDVYEYIAECDTFDTAVNCLKELYIKPPNEIYARHLLATCCQKEEENIDEYVQRLQLLAKECNFKPVDAVQNHDDCVRDAFISGLRSNVIRQRLLENKTLQLNVAIDQARALHTAQKNSEAYTHTQTAIVGAVSLENTTNSFQPTDLVNTRCATTAKNSCFFCGRPRHNRSVCAARNAICFKCKREGHFSKMCRSNPKITSAATCSHRLATMLITNTTSASLGPLKQAALYVLVGKYGAGTALMDTGSSGSFISLGYVRKHRLYMKPAAGNVSMASSSLRASIKGQCTVDLNLLREWYPDVKLSVLPNLCSDIILGQDFMSQHSTISFAFGGSKKDLVISDPISCSVPSALVDIPSLFSNIDPDCKPITTKSKRSGEGDRLFIQTEIEKMIKEGVIEESTSPWRAQVLIVTNERQRKRLVVDYSRTINRFTRLDAYPLPRMDDLAQEISKFKIYSSLDLKSAYHQIPIKEEDKPYKAFEANGKLYQFCRIPLGVTNGVACFQRVIDKIIEENNLKGVYAYVDNIVVVGKNQQDHDENLEKFKRITTQYNLTLNEDKSVFSKTSIDFLGYNISQGLLRPDAERLRPLRELPVPQNKTSLRRVLGLFSYYSQWIPKFSDKIRPLITANSFSLDPESIKTFENFKEEIEKALLRSVDEKIPLVVETDASDTAIAATLNLFTHTYDYRTKTFFRRKGGLCNSRISQKVVTLPISATFCDSHRSTSCEFHVRCKKTWKNQE